VSDATPPASGEPSPPRKASPRPWRIALIVGIPVGLSVAIPVTVVLVLGDTLGGDGVVVSSSRATGQLRSRGGPHGDYAIAPTFCRTLGLRSLGFERGAVLHVSKHGGLERGAIRVRELEDDEHEVKILVPGKCRDPKDERTCEVVRLRNRDCGFFDARIVAKGRFLSQGRRVYGFDGHASLSCTLADGTAVEGDLAFTGCD
jgi:hypothetical protein